MCNLANIHGTHGINDATSSGSGSGSGTIPATARALIPTHPACADALALAKASLPASILYHSFRVYLYAQAFIRQDPASQSIVIGAPAPAPGHVDKAYPHVLFVACILHDVGTSSTHGDAIPERFEVVGADVAARLLRSHGISDGEVRDAWLAISLHTSPGIAERLGGTVRALRLAVRADFGSYPPPPADQIPGGADTLVNLIRWQLPRLEIEKDLGDAVVRQALLKPQKAPAASWPGDLVRAHEEDPKWNGVNKAF
ncbi:hypothetical protein QBC46DRAFT_395155 [Diplogelasinospora grovesii]|uniref:HD/PDEase domain-containing protein n=1 Tax=Diplogelasinospora grovesii TaxID=303347 RepID=A0AAN6S1D8_9PEZI|nr:hypothetical protein QBC46DRAFT_395155 [Diplogelasinospora grovesii]